jgi:hypothetical protein
VNVAWQAGLKWQLGAQITPTLAIGDVRVASFQNLVAVMVPNHVFVLELRSWNSGSKIAKPSVARR